MAEREKYVRQLLEKWTRIAERHAARAGLLNAVVTELALREDEVGRKARLAIYIMGKKYPHPNVEWPRNEGGS